MRDRSIIFLMALLGVYDLLQRFDFSFLVAVSFSSPSGDTYSDDNKGNESISDIRGM